MADASCTREIKEVNKDYSIHKLQYEMGVDDALYNLIGNPIKGQKNYKEHKQLYDGLREYFMESGNLTDFTHDPWLMKEQWADHWDTKFIDYFSNVSVPQLSKQRLKSMYTDFKKIKVKRAKAFKKAQDKDGMSNISRALLPPSILAMKYDRYGFVSKIVKATKNLSDKVKQSWNTFDTRIADSLEDYRLIMEDQFGKVDDTKIMDGIHELVDSKGEMYSILEVRKVGNRRQFKIEYKKKQKEEWTTVEWEKENMSEQKWKETFIRKYRDDFINDILHGQTRKLEWKSRDDLKKNPEHRAIVEQEMLKRQNREKHADIAQKDERLDNQFISIENDNGEVIWEGEAQFIQVKNKEGSADARANGESYSTYFIGYMDTDGNFISSGKDYNRALAALKLRNGYYKADTTYEYKHYQRTLNQKELRSLGLVDKKGYIDNKKYEAWADKQNELGYYYKVAPHQAWTGFQYMENQPDEQMVSNRTGGHDIHQVIADYRDVYKDVRIDIEKFVDKNEKRRQNVEKTMMSNLMAKGLSEDEAQLFMQENIFSWANLQTMARKNEAGEIRTPDGYFVGREQNYAPLMWSGENYNNMLAVALRNIQERIAQAEANEEPTTELEAQKEDFLKLLSMDMNQPQDRGMMDSAASVHLETRKTWTDWNKRRRNSHVHLDYLDKTYRNLHRNDLLIDMMEQMNNMLKTEKGIPKGSMDYMVNRVKLSFGRDDVNTNLGFMQTNNQEIADAINSLPSWMRLGRTWDAATAEKMWLTTNGVLTMKFLGATGAMANRTQSVNNIIHYGFANWLHSRKVMNQESEKWDRIIANTGVENLLSMFNDIMLQGGQVEWGDAGFFPYSDVAIKGMTGFDIPYPKQIFRDWLRIRKAGKQKFIQNTDSNNVYNRDIDAVMLRLMNRNLTIDAQRDVDFARTLQTVLTEYKRSGKIDYSQLSEEQIVELKEKRSVYWDIMELGKDENVEAILEKKLEKLLGTVDDNLLKKMVTFKLQYWKEGLGEEVFTFTEGEKAMRRETVVQALLVADQKGLLGNGEDRFMSPVAVKIARDAVYQMMFGMSPVYLGEAFSGLGRGVMQYKSYPLFQYIKDKNTVENWWNGGDVAENLGRLFQAGKIMATTPDARINDSDLDQDAIAMLRTIMTRFMATAIATTAHAMAPVSYLLRKTPFGDLIRSAENPMLALASRTALWGVMIAMGAGWEDEERTGEEARNKWIFMFTPTLLGYFARMGYDGITSLNDAEGIWSVFD